jgi:LysM repeat protein
VTNTIEIKVATTKDVTDLTSTNIATNVDKTPEVGGRKASEDSADESNGMVNEAKPPEIHRQVYCPEYIIKPGDEVLRLARRYSFRIADFRAVNPGVDENRVRVGQKVKIPGFFKEENLPK